MWWLISAHFIGDWALQSRWIAENKSSIPEILFAHCMIYAATISIALQYLNILSPWKVVFLIVTHFITDSWSSNKHKNCSNFSEKRRTLYIDHMYHLIQLLIVYYL
jgi:hypothetical protein